MDGVSLSKEIITDLTQIGTEKQFKSQHTLIEYQSKANKLFLIVQGGAVLFHIHPETLVERAINFFTPNFHPLASIADSFYLNTPSDYHLKTYTNTRLIEISKKDFNEYLRTSENAMLMQDFGIRTLLDKNKLRTNLISLSSLEMFQHLHKHYPQIIQQIPSKYIADFLGITPQWLSKLKRNL